jgi:hypothetical protein
MKGANRMETSITLDRKDVKKRANMFVRICLGFLVTMLLLSSGILVKIVYQEKQEQEGYISDLKKIDITDEKREAIHKKAAARWNSQSWRDEVAHAYKEGIWNRYVSLIANVEFAPDWKKYAELAAAHGEKHKLNPKELKQLIDRRMKESNK